MISKYSMKTNSVHDISSNIKAEAKRLGFSACGIAKAGPVDKMVADAYRKWLAEGNNADMGYLENNLDKRLDPTLLMPEAKSIICFALNYYPEKKLSANQYQFAYYSYGKDYHEVMKAKMRELVSYLSLSYPDLVSKLCVDTVPMLDRYWAQKAGLGWVGKNTNLIIPQAGSFFFLCEVIIDVELEYDSPMDNHCGSCEKCLEACPTQALSTPYYINARKCLSCVTIEHKGEFDNEQKHLFKQNRECSQNISSYIYGCDRCQLACPYNRFAVPTKIEEFIPKDEFLNMTTDDWHQLTIEQFRELFKDSSVKRTKYEGLMRNINLQKSPLHDQH